MSEPEDWELLKQYSASHSERAFATLVERHVNPVYSTALRRTGNPAAAEEITQVVFILLARKARSLSRSTVLAGWLYQATRAMAANYLRSEIRRRRREQEALMRSSANETDPELWKQIAPVFDDALGRLSEGDRNAIILRYFQNKSAEEMARELGIEASAAQKRLTRAVERLRAFFAKAGITSTTALLSAAISTHSLQMAPVALVQAAIASAVAGNTPAGSLTLIKGTLKLMAWSKAKTTAIVATVILLVGTAVVTVRENQAHRTYPWQHEPFDFKQVDLQPPQVRILPSKAKSDNWDRQSGPSGKMMGLGMRTEQIVLRAYGARPVRTVLTYDEPSTTYDFIANLPTNNAEALQEELKRVLGIVARRVMIETNVLVLSVNFSPAPGLRPATDSNAAPSFTRAPGQMSIRNGNLLRLLVMMEGQFQQPIVDRTGLSNHLDLDFKWNDADPTFHDPAVLAGVKQAMLNQLGLQLIAASESVEMLVVEKTK
jgi:uncharacterized protein (TIGR03435 family)